MNKLTLGLVGFFMILSLVFFRQTLFQGKVPVPADTIVGLYHPFRDLYANEYPRGIPFKNFLITDPVRQQFPWRNLAITLERKLEIPTWNPYVFAGMPLLANFQTGAFYPLNIIFFTLPFEYSWTALIILQPFLAGIFMYLYLRHMKLSIYGCLLGTITFAFSGFSIAWLEWNTIFHVLLWLPLILLAKEHLLHKKSSIWIVVFVFAELSAIFAGHLQMLFYTVLVSNAYLIARIIQLNMQKNTLKNFFKSYSVFAVLGIVVLLFTAIQWIPTLQLIMESARNVDQANNWQQPGWFIPPQHLIQFIAPDFFGNPATLNYWGVWNYAEFIGYISIFPLIMVIYALLFRRDRKTLFFVTLVVLAFLFSLPTPIAQLPFFLNVPFVATSQPTRLLGIISFGLSVLAGLGLDYYLRSRKSIYIPLMIIFGAFMGLWLYIFKDNIIASSITPENLLVAKRNMILPTLVFIASSAVLLLYRFIHTRRYAKVLIVLLFVITLYDLFRLSDKFLSFSNKEYLYPTTKTIDFLQTNAGYYRIMAVDDRILPPNFSLMYKLQMISGYDPLYLRRYAEVIVASERSKADISPPFGFNRIITPKNYESRIIDLLGVKYVLSLSDIKSSKLEKVFQEGETRVYENKSVLPRVFFAQNYHDFFYKKEKDQVIALLFDEGFDIKKEVVIEYEYADNIAVSRVPKSQLSVGQAKIINYSENKIVIETINEGKGFLILTDTFYPTWKAKIDGHDTKIYRANYNFRGIFVPEGKHSIEFYNSLFAL